MCITMQNNDVVVVVLLQCTENLQRVGLKPAVNSTSYSSITQTHRWYINIAAHLQETTSLILAPDFSLDSNSW